MDIMIPADDPVRLLSAFVEGMDLSELYATYDRIRKNQATPRQMLIIMICVSMNRLFSSRDIETACNRDINFMYLLEGKRHRITLRLHGSSPLICPHVQRNCFPQSQRCCSNWKNTSNLFMEPDATKANSKNRSKHLGNTSLS